MLATLTQSLERKPVTKVLEAAVGTVSLLGAASGAFILGIFLVYIIVSPP